MPASIAERQLSTVRFADKSAMTSVHVTLFSSGTSLGTIDAAGLEDEALS